MLGVGSPELTLLIINDEEFVPSDQRLPISPTALETTVLVSVSLSSTFLKKF